MEPLTELARRSKGQAPPPWVIWEALCDAWRSNGRDRFDVRTGELVPGVLESRRPDLVPSTPKGPNIEAELRRGSAGPENNRHEARASSLDGDPYCNHPQRRGSIRAEAS